MGCVELPIFRASDRAFNAPYPSLQSSVNAACKMVSLVILFGAPIVSSINNVWY